MPEPNRKSTFVYAYCCSHLVCCQDLQPPCKHVNVPFTGSDSIQGRLLLTAAPALLAESAHL